MKFLAALLACIALVCPAYADMYQDGSNAKLPAAVGATPKSVCLNTAGDMVGTIGNCAGVAPLAAGADATAAINACLASVLGGTCYVGGGRFTINGDVHIPAGTTLSCGDSFSDMEDGAWTLLGTLPALLLDSARSIRAAGPSATVKNCLIERAGMTFPANGSGAYAGTAVVDDYNGNMVIRDTVIIGFDSAIFLQGPRPYLNHIHADGNGVTHAVIEHAISGAFDVGYLEDIKVQPLGTGNYNLSTGVTCAQAARPGTGVRLGGIDYLGNIISQNYAVAQVEISNQALGGYIWTDDLGPRCGYGNNSIGVLLSGNAILYNTSLNINSTQTGLKVAITSNLLNYLPSVFLDYIGQDAIVIQQGNLSIGALNTNPYSTNVTWTGSISGTTMSVSGLTGTLTDGAFVIGTGVTPGTQIVGSCTTSCVVNTSQTVASTAMHTLGAVGRYVINMGDATGASRVTINKAALNGVQSGVPPYFFTSSTANNVLGDQLAIDNLQSDLINPFAGTGGLNAGPGADPMLKFIPMEQGPCSGMDTGVCTIQPGSTITRGAFLLQPAGTAAGTGAIFMSFAVPASTAYICNVQMASGSGAWPFNSSPLTLNSESGGGTIDVGWTAPLVPGQTYQILYSCKP